MTTSEPPNRSEPQTIAPFGCQNCRDQHLKCDRGTPSCGRCLANGKDCKRGYKFRVKSGPFNRKQQWVRTPRKLEFIEDGATDEGEYVEDDALSSSSARSQTFPEEWKTASASANVSATASATATVTARSKPDRSQSIFRTEEQEQRVVPQATDQASLSRPADLSQPAQNIPSLNRIHGSDMLLDLVPTNQLGQVDQERPLSPSDRFIVHDEFLDPPAPPPPAPAPAPAPPPNPGMHDQNGNRPAQARIYIDQSVYPLQDKQEAILLRHYVEKLAIWLDLCEPTRQFSMTVPQRAGTCKVLLYAIFALSAKHLAHVSNFDPYTSDRYHQECLKALIPLLSDEVTAMDENLFAATIILRVLEEMEVKHTGVDFHSYLLGIHAFVHGHGYNLLPNTLSAAAFWVGLRQEIYSATVNHQPVLAPLAPLLVDESRGLGPTEDQSWANRAVVHCVDVLNFCFGESPKQSWNELNEWNRRWKELLPPSYTPTLYKERGPGEAFPEIWYHNTWHVTGVQHHILAELYLASFDPKLPRVGAQRLEAGKRVDRTATTEIYESERRVDNEKMRSLTMIQHRIRALVRQICGIGLGNQWTPPALFATSMAIASFGDRFHERPDQEAMLEILRLTERDHGPADRVCAATNDAVMGLAGGEMSEMNGMSRGARVSSNR